MDINYKEQFNEKFGDKIKSLKSYVKFEKREVAVAGISTIAIAIINIAIYFYMNMSGQNNILSPLWVMFIAVAGNIKVDVVGQLDFFSSHIDIGIFIVIIANFVLIALVNLIIYKRKHIDSLKENIVSALKTGIYYALIMSIISIFSGIKVEAGSEMMFRTVYISFGYTIISVFGNSFIIATLATMIANWKKEFRGENRYIDLFADTLKFVLTTLAICFVISIAMMILKPAVFAGTSISKYPKIISFAQIGAYILMIASGGNIKMSNGSISGMDIFTGNVNTDARLFLMLTISIVWIMFIIRGSKIKEKKDIISNAVVYAFIIYIISRFISVNINISDMGIDIGIIESEIIYSVSPIVMFICSMIISFVMMYLGYMFSNSCDKDEDDKKWKKYNNTFEEKHIYDVEFEEVK